MNFSDHIFQQDTSQTKTIPPRIMSDRGGRTSAKSSLAHWDEDWTLIADMTERRRIQNRIAQRNYRRRLKERLSRLEEHASRQSSSTQDKPVRDKKDKSRKSSSSQSQTRHKDILPLRMADPETATDKSSSSKTSYQVPDVRVDQQSFSSSYPLSPNTWSLGSHSMNGYSDFSTMFEDPVFDYPDTQVWRRATWPHG